MFDSDDLKILATPPEKTLKDYRQRQGLSEGAVAAAIGVEQPTIHGWEDVNSDSKTMRITQEQLSKYMILLKVAPDQFADAVVRRVSILEVEADSLEKMLEVIADAQ